MSEAHIESYVHAAHLHESMDSNFESFFNVEDNGILDLQVGYVSTAEGPGYFDVAVIFCPFCGNRLQGEDEIARRAV